MCRTASNASSTEKYNFAKTTKTRGITQVVQFPGKLFIFVQVDYATLSLVPLSNCSGDKKLTIWKAMKKGDAYGKKSQNIALVKLKRKNVYCLLSHL